MKCTQQDGVYRAEREIPRGREFKTPAEVEEFFEALRERYPRWKYDFRGVLFIDVFVVDQERSTARVVEDGGVVCLRPGRMFEREALHELSHVLADTRYGDCGHSPWYARIMLELVYTSMGPKAYQELNTAYEAESVDHRTDDAGVNGVAL